MKELNYREFSLKTHKAGLRLHAPAACQFEVTFECALHCRHCYSDCYNDGSFIARELDTGQVKGVIDAIKRLGVVWLCFTGGDPLTRNDFPEIYSYAKHKGFLVTVFTSGYSLTKEVVRLFQRQPPFVVEITVNAVEKKLFEKISRVSGSFYRVCRAIRWLEKANIPLKIKTQVTKDNLAHLPEIRKFLKDRGLPFQPNYHILAGLNHDPSPCSLRVSPGTLASAEAKDTDCFPFLGEKKVRNRLFSCAVASGSGCAVDPYGNLFLCRGLRDRSVNILDRSAKSSLDGLLCFFRERDFLTGSACAACVKRAACFNCPGKAYLETGDMEARIPYYCAVAERVIHYGR